MLGGLWQGDDEEEEETLQREEEEGEEDEDGVEALGFFGGWLPEEVAVRVFRWLSPYDIARAEVVCRQWHSLLVLSASSSSLTPWLWRKARHLNSLIASSSSAGQPSNSCVHERHFGGPVPKKKKAYDQRTFCLYSARNLHKFEQTPERMELMLTWAITCGHHAALAYLIDKYPAASLVLSVIGVLPMAIATNSERMVELVCAHSQPVSPFMFVAAVRRGSLPIVGVLLRHLPKRTEEDNGKTESMLDHLESLLSESHSSTQRLWHVAAAGGHTSLMEHLITLHKEHSQESYLKLLCSFDSIRGYTALQNACAQNNRRVFDFLVKGHTCDELLNAEVRKSRLSALHLAVKHADLDFTQRLLALGARETGFGTSLLHAACAADRNRQELMALFVDRVADVNELTITGRGRGCLHILAGSTLTTIEHVQFLLDKGADARLLSRERQTALEPLLSSQPKNAEDLARRLSIGDLLLAHDCPLVGRKSLLVLVLGWLGHHRWMPSDQEAWRQAEALAHEALEWLFGRAGGPALVEGTKDLDAVCALAGVSSPRIMVLMVAHGFDLNHHTVLEALFSRGAPFVLETNLQALVGLGLDVNIRHPQTGLTPVHFLPWQHIPLLARYGADVNAVDAQGQTVLARSIDNYAFLSTTLSRSQVQATLQRLGVDRWDEQAPSALWVARAQDRRKWHAVSQALAQLQSYRNEFS